MTRRLDINASLIEEKVKHPMKKIIILSVLVALSNAASPRSCAAQTASDDPTTRQEVIDRGEDQLGGALIDAGENLAKGLGKSLKQEAKRDITGLEREVLPQPASQPPQPTQPVADDSLEDIQKDVAKLEKEAAE